MGPRTGDRFLKGLGAALAAAGLVAIFLADADHAPVTWVLLGVVAVLSGFILFTTAEGHARRTRGAVKGPPLP